MVQILEVFNAYDGLLVSQEPEWLQGALNVLVRLFLRIGLPSNVAKLKAMMCQPGEIRSGISEETFGYRSTG